MISLYINSHTVGLYDRQLACEIGLNEAIFLSQLSYWLEKSKHVIEGEKWIYKKVKDWKDQDFPFWSEDTIKRIIKKLEEQEYIISGNFNKAAFDKTKWYRINHNLPIVQNGPTRVANCPMESSKMHSTIPEITTETTTDINKLLHNVVSKETTESQGQNSSRENHPLYKINEFLSTKSESDRKYILTNSEANALHGDLLFKGNLFTEMVLEGKSSVDWLPVSNKRDGLTLFKIIVSHLRSFNRVITKEELNKILYLKNKPKKRFSPSEIETASQKAKADGFTEGYVDAFENYLWSSRGNYAIPKQVKRESASKQVDVMDDFSDFE